MPPWHLGLLAHTKLLELPSGLHLLGSWWVIGAAIALFAIEFFADKIPAFDLFWNALHTFIRIPVAALIAYGASSHLSRRCNWSRRWRGDDCLGGARRKDRSARSRHTVSEPVSNFVLSAGEDTLAVFLTWLATQHPLAAAGIAAAILIVIVVMARWIVRTIVRAFKTSAPAV